MNTLHFKYAVEVERTGSITQAADNLFMAQPNLSKAIKELEDTLGITIFERSSKGVVPTPKGVQFLCYAKNILGQIDKMEALYIPEDARRQCFSISIPRGTYIVTGFTEFVKALDPHREIDVNVQETNSMQTISNITDGQFNLGIIRYQTVHESYFAGYLAEKGLSSETVWEYESLVLMSKNHPLAEVPTLQYDALGEYVEIIHGDTMIPYLSVKEIYRPNETAHAKRRVIVYERCSQFEILSTVPVTYMWVSPIPEGMLGRYELVQRKCKGAKFQFKDVLVYPKDYKFTELDRLFIEKMQNQRHAVSSREYR